MLAAILCNSVQPHGLSDSGHYPGPYFRRRFKHRKGERIYAGIDAFLAELEAAPQSEIEKFAKIDVGIGSANSMPLAGTSTADAQIERWLREYDQKLLGIFLEIQYARDEEDAIILLLM